MRYQNLFINSYNKSTTDSNYDYNLSIPEHDISCGENEEMSLTITNFNTPNIFYNITEQNNKFYFTTIEPGAIITTATMVIAPGSYDVYTLATAIDELIKDLANCTYLPLINKMEFRRKNNNSTTIILNFFSDIFKILNAYNRNMFLLDKDVGTLTGVLNMNRFNYLLIYITGITCYNQNISNITNNQFKLSNLVAIINRADVLPYGNINYVEINNNNQILLGNKKITNLNIKITDEFGNLLTDLDNWTMTLKFVISKKNMI